MMTKTDVEKLIADDEDDWKESFEPLKIAVANPNLGN